jgi:Flp pilus assembly protein TadD
MDPNFSFAHLRLGVAYAHKGMYEQAVDELQKAIALNENDPFFVAQLGAIYAMRGQKSQAMKIVEDLTKLHTRSKPMAGAIAAIYADLNDKEKALEWLTEAYEAHDPQLWLEINGDRRWDILLSDARFTALLQRMGFQSANTR